MKFLITGNQLEKVALLWMNKNFSPDQLDVVTSERYPNSIFYRKNGKVVMEQDKKNKRFYFDYDEIYSFFKSFFGMQSQEIRDILSYWLEETLNLRGYTPQLKTFFTSLKLEETFNLRGYTPGGIITSTLERWKKLPI